MFDQMKKMMELKKQADKIKKELDKVELECKDVRGIELTINGSQYLQKVDIDDTWFDVEKKKRFQTELVRAINTAIKRSQKVAAQKMQASGGFPGLG